MTGNILKITAAILTRAARESDKTKGTFVRLALGGVQRQLGRPTLALVCESNVDRLVKTRSASSDATRSSSHCFLAINRTVFSPSTRKSAQKRTENRCFLPGVARDASLTTTQCLSCGFETPPPSSQFLFFGTTTTRNADRTCRWRQR